MGTSGELLLSLDLGTTAIKVGLFSVTGTLLRLGRREQSLSFPQPNWVQQSPLRSWQLVVEATREILADLDRGKVVALVLTNQRGSVVPIGRDGEPLTDVIVWMDQRGLGQVDRLRALVGAEAYYRTSGHPIVPITGVSKLLWLQQEAPQIWEKVESAGPPQTLFLKWLGCNEALVDYSSGSYLFPCDIRRREWSQEIAGLLSFPLERLPRLIGATEVVGRLSKKASTALSLLEGTPIVAGGGDGQCAAAGTGVVLPGSVMVNIGTATGVQVFLAEPAFDPANTLNCAAHIVPGAWEMEGHTQASGAVFRWLRDEFGSAEVLESEQSGQDAYDLLVKQASDAPAGSDGLVFLPTFNGSTAPVVDPHVRGALIGLKLSHRRSHVLRAVLEGISLEIRWIIDAIAKTGVPVEEIRLAGGGSKNKTWNQIHADILNRPVCTVQNPDAALVGAAMCAAVALGVFADFQQASRTFVKVGPRLTPLPENQLVYSRTYERFVDLFTLLSHQRAFTP